MIFGITKHKERFSSCQLCLSPGIPSPTALGNNCPRKRFRSCSCSYDFQSGKVCKDGVGHFGVQQFSILIYDLPLKTSQERTKGLGFFFITVLGCQAMYISSTEKKTSFFLLRIGGLLRGFLIHFATKYLGSSLRITQYFETLRDVAANNRFWILKCEKSCNKKKRLNGIHFFLMDTKILVDLLTFFLKKDGLYEV